MKEANPSLSVCLASKDSITICQDKLDANSVVLLRQRLVGLQPVNVSVPTESSLRPLALVFVKAATNQRMELRIETVWMIASRLSTLSVMTIKSQTSLASVSTQKKSKKSVTGSAQAVEVSSLRALDSASARSLQMLKKFVMLRVKRVCRRLCWAKTVKWS